MIHDNTATMRRSTRQSAASSAANTPAVKKENDPKKFKFEPPTPPTPPKKSQSSASEKKRPESLRRSSHISVELNGSTRKSTRTRTPAIKMKSGSSSPELLHSSPVRPRRNAQFQLEPETLVIDDDDEAEQSEEELVERKESTMKITVVGSGGWGTALALVLEELA